MKGRRGSGLCGQRPAFWGRVNGRVGVFLNEYTRALELDAMDLWCWTFFAVWGVEQWRVGAVLCP